MADFLFSEYNFPGFIQVLWLEFQNVNGKNLDDILKKQTIV